MGARREIGGMKFGRLLVLRKGRSIKSLTHWLCRCDCGEVVEVSTNALVRGATRSCGCLRKEKTSRMAREAREAGKAGCTLVDITGMRFGRLLVLYRVGTDTNKRATFMCRCDCGVEKVISSHNLRHGRIKSCGCLRRELAKKQMEVINNGQS